MAKRRKRRPAPKRYILEGDRPVEELDPSRWSTWHKQFAEDCLLGNDQLDEMDVTTSFTGVADIPRLDPGPPKLYKTVVTGGKGNGMFRAYATDPQARAGHGEMLRMLEKYFAGKSSD